MIILLDDFGNTFSQEIYDKLIDGLNLMALECPTCHHKGCLVKFGLYKRKVKSESVEIVLWIQRVKCTECSDENHTHTHSLMQSNIVPYSQIPLSDQVAIIDAAGDREKTTAILENNNLLDFNYVYRILKIYQTIWKERILSERISLSDLRHLCVSCISIFFRQFMQIKKIPINFFSIST